MYRYIHIQKCIYIYIYIHVYITCNYDSTAPAFLGTRFARLVKASKAPELRPCRPAAN